MSIAPFVQTPLEVAKKMLDLSQIKPGEVLYDLGCGDGRLIILAAKDVGAKSTGIELRKISWNERERRSRDLTWKTK